MASEKTPSLTYQEGLCPWCRKHEAGAHHSCYDAYLLLEQELEVLRTQRTRLRDYLKALHIDERRIESAVPPHKAFLEGQATMLSKIILAFPELFLRQKETE